MTASDFSLDDCQLNLIRAQGLLNRTVHRILEYIESKDCYELYEQALEIHKVSSNLNDILDDLILIETGNYG